MRALLAAAIAACLLLIATPAGAEGVSWPNIPASSDAGGPRWNRTTAYVGLTGGYDLAALQSDTFTFADNSLFGGAFAGFNARMGDQLVVGIEGDYLVTDIKGASGDGTVTITASTRYLATIRARVGVPVGPALLYVTGGPAFTQSKVAVTDGEMSGAAKETLIGGAFGAGVEAELTKSLFVRLEGIHYIFPDKGVPFGSEMLNTENQQTTVRLGVGFKLN